MVDDPIARAREAVKRLQDAGGPDAAALAPLLEEALGQVANSLNRLAEAQRNLATQQALLDDRLLRVEHNRAFTAFNRMVAAGGSVLQRVRNSLPARPRDGTEDPAAYTKWVAHELAGQPTPEQARAVSSGWAHRPKIRFDPR